MRIPHQCLPYPNRNRSHGRNLRQRRGTALNVALCLCLSAACVSTFCAAQQPAKEGAPRLDAGESASGSALPAAEPRATMPVAATAQPGSQLTLRGRWAVEARTTFGPPAFLLPAAVAGIAMADPPHDYPHDWRDGGPGFGRNYGADFARHTAGGLAHFTVAAILREDPRYYRSAGTHFFGRFGHAVLFTLVDRSDSGRRTIAVSNLAGSTAAGFIGMAFYPPGFDDNTHAYQRGTLEMANFAAHNLAAEFAPQMAALARKLHFPGRADGSSMPVDAEKP